MTDHTERGEVLSSTDFGELVGRLEAAGPQANVRDDLLAHDAALRARIEEMREALTEVRDLTTVGTISVLDTIADRARRTLQGGDDE